MRLVEAVREVLLAEKCVSRTLSAGGMAGWQVALIAAGATLAAAATAVLADHKLAGRRGVTATTA